MQTTSRLLTLANILVDEALDFRLVEALILALEDDAERFQECLSQLYSERYPDQAATLFTGPVDPRRRTTRPRPVRR